MPKTLREKLAGLAVSMTGRPMPPSWPPILPPPAGSCGTVIRNSRVNSPFPQDSGQGPQALADNPAVIAEGLVE